MSMPNSIRSTHALSPWPLALACLIGLFSTNAGAQAFQPAPPSASTGLRFLVVNDAAIPHVRVSWTGEAGQTVTLEADRPYTSPTERTPLGTNLECFVALGGTRLDKQAGDPNGAILRVGLYKIDPTGPFFEGLENDAPIEIVVSNIVFDKPARARPITGVQHIKYLPSDLEACGLGGKAFELYNTVSPTDTLNGNITPDNGRLGVLDPALLPEHKGTEFTVRQEPDGSFTLLARIPYSLLRHINDPWKLSKPGTFTEPQHFHLEFEAIPLLDVPDALRPHAPDAPD